MRTGLIARAEPVDARDTARAVRLALEAPLAGFQPFFIAAPDTRHPVPTLDLLRHAFAALCHPARASSTPGKPSSAPSAPGACSAGGRRAHGRIGRKGSAAW
jgi:hypothetical protein